jgi:phenylalanyl-tRNA synthetase alpha chain
MTPAAGSASGSGQPPLDFDKLKSEALSAIASASDDAALEQLRIHFLGRKSPLKETLSGIGALPPDDRKRVGVEANAVAAAIEAALETRVAELRSAGGEVLAQAEATDLTFPGTPPRLGHPHPVSRVMLEIEEIFRGLGYDVARGPEVETDYYNFEALNMQPGHPARDNFDSFFVEGGGESWDRTERVLLRTHTSPMQIRYMESHPPPIKAIFPGKAYRRDNDATHVPMFHQVEGLLVDEGVTVTDLKGTLEYFARAMFGDERRIRLRPDYFPFTEPSLEVHVSCFVCNGEGCRLCSMSGWIEILGAGMVHPAVLRFGGVDPDRFTGFAFGMGGDRVAMLKYGINDLRMLFDNDVRMIQQF